MLPPLLHRYLGLTAYLPSGLSDRYTLRHRFRAGPRGTWPYVIAVETGCGDGPDLKAMQGTEHHVQFRSLKAIVQSRFTVSCKVRY
jgi:hypothetical protein